MIAQDQPYGDAAAELAGLRAVVDARLQAIGAAVAVMRRDAFTGPAAEAAVLRFQGLADALDGVRSELSSAIPALLQAEVIDAALVRMINQAGSAPSTVPGAAGFAASLHAQRLLLNGQVAAFLAWVCGPVEDLGMDRLHLRQDQPLSRVHAENLDALSPELREVVARHGGVVLESGDGGITMLVGHGLADPSDSAALDRLNPDSVTTLVAGMRSNNEPQTVDDYLARGLQLSEATGGPTAVWLGYDAPYSLVPDAADGTYADEGAMHLSLFQAALTERFPAATSTVVAHSYGTVTASEAAATHGLAADHLVLMASPGVRSPNADGLHLFSADPQVVVIDDVLDPIKLLRGPFSAYHGSNPNTAWFGADQRVPMVGAGHTGHWDNPALLWTLHQLHAGAASDPGGAGPIARTMDAVE